MSKRDTFYFPHEYNAKDDPKCERVIWEMGMEGYGMFWTLLEVLRAQPDYTYPVANISIIARKYNADENKMRQVVFDYGLFTIIEDRMFFSNGLKMRMQPMDEKRNRQSSGGKEGAKKRWGNGGENRLPNGYPISSPNGLPYSNKIIIDKKRGDESKGDCKGVAVKRESNNASATTGADKPRKRRRPSPASPTPDEFEEIVRFYNDTCKSLRPVQVRTGKRRAAVSARLREHGREAVFNVIRAAGRSSFLAGQNTRGWTADFDWIFRPVNFVKVSEGKYENMEKSQQHGNESDQPSVTSVRIPL